MKKELEAEGDMRERLVFNLKNIYWKKSNHEKAFDFFSSNRNIHAARNILAAGQAVSALGENVNLVSVSDISCSR